MLTLLQLRQDQLLFSGLLVESILLLSVLIQIQGKSLDRLGHVELAAFNWHVARLRPVGNLVVETLNGSALRARCQTRPVRGADSLQNWPSQLRSFLQTAMQNPLLPCVFRFLWRKRGAGQVST